MRKLRQHIEPRIGHGDDALVRINRAKRVVCRLRFSRACDSVKQRAFPHIRETDNSCAQHRPRTLAEALPRRTDLFRVMRPLDTGLMTMSVASAAGQFETKRAVILSVSEESRRP